MTTSRREFVKIAGSAGALALSGPVRAAVRGSGTPANATLPTGPSSFCLDIAPLAGADATITDFSGFRYCPEVDALMLFGGGHAATPEDVVLRFPMKTLHWSADYPATSKAVMLQTNPDGGYKYLTAGKFWKVPGEQPPLRPVSRHTYSGFIWSSAIKRMLLLMGNNGNQYGFTGEVTGGNAAEYDPVTRTWKDIGIPGVRADVSFCEDPISGLIMTQVAGAFRVYDPKQRKWVASIGLNGVPFFGYAANTIYYPPTDRFYYIGRDVDPSIRCIRVFEFAFDRTNLRPAYTEPNGPDRGHPMPTNWRPASGGDGETGYAYDSTNKLIVGAMGNGVMLGFKPHGNGSGTWYQHPAPGATFTTFHCHDYAATVNAHFAICTVPGNGKQTFAFRWDTSKATLPVDPYLSIPHAKITPPATSLEAACLIGGAIHLTAGELHDREANAHPRRACNIVGQGTKLISVGAEGKGIIITDADVRLENVDISGASVGDGNGAAIRQQTGNVTLEKVRLHGNQNGILGPASDVPGTLVMNDCDVYANGTGTGQTHGVYIGKITRFVCSNSRFWDTSVGHHIKSRARQSVIERCQVGTNFTGNESYNIDIPIGGDALVTDSTLRQGPRSENAVMLNYGSESHPYPAGTLRVNRCRFESTAGGVGIRNALPNVIADIRNCDFVGVKTPVVGTHTLRDCTMNGKPMPNVAATQTPHEVIPGEPR